MEVTLVPVTGFQQNCSVLRCSKTGLGAVVDPGGDLDRVMSAITRTKTEIALILQTHCHVDHAGQTAAMKRRLRVPIEGPHEDDRFWIEALPEAARMFGLEPAEVFEPDRWLVGGDTVQFGDVVLDVRQCPGHTPGHVVFFQRESKIAIVGDVLFKGSIGRTDFPRGDQDTLIRSIQTELLPLGDDVTFIPGHGPTSTFGEERRTNPFLLRAQRAR
jgi:glyoxylase-like metal-dependent hydrolase (beta-lactamase superfamily II)